MEIKIESNAKKSWISKAIRCFNSTCSESFMGDFLFNMLVVITISITAASLVSIAFDFGLEKGCKYYMTQVKPISEEQYNVLYNKCLEG